MPSNAKLAAKLLRNAAEFFRSVGEQNAELKEQMRTNANTYDMVAEWVEQDAGAEGAPGGDRESGREPAGEGSAQEATEGGSGGEKTGPGDG